VIAVTGYATPEDERRAKAAGFNAYIQKPFVPADVVSTLAGLLSRMDRPA
jgi:CheY-like chemotaxis protein